MNNTYLEPRLSKLVEEGISGLDILHGELKNQMLEAEDELEKAQKIEEDNDYSDAMESMERKYWEGYTDALMSVYSLTYALSFAEGEQQRNK